MSQPENAIVAGVDGSVRSIEAAQWAAGEARRHSTRLHVLLINDDSARDGSAGEAVREAAAACREAAPDVPVSAEVRAGHPVEGLLRAEEAARLLVLGSRGLGGFADALLGSVSSEVATRASGAVVVVRGDVVHSGGPVVVGLDDSPGIDNALRFALDAAAARGCELLAVQAWHEAGLLAPSLPPAERDETQLRIEQHAHQQLAEWTNRYPGLRARAVAVLAHPVPALVDAAATSPLLVVGHRGSGGFSGLFLGSVASGVLHHARCPVAVVR
ncbi:universal stress protein [Saccharopolyspora gregorii]|uniref:universal stress protein n=1 Tax=Saccharopolyspora gregorii TaxID=33914 RepID=UPI0021AC165B|nr:universal stress protein [Saccharopolyspora gregorii]